MEQSDCVTVLPAQIFDEDEADEERNIRLRKAFAAWRKMFSEAIQRSQDVGPREPKNFVSKAYNN